MKPLISIALTILLTLLVMAEEGEKPKNVEISGFVVARDVLTSLVKLSYHDMSSEVVIVRVEKPKELAEQYRYIKVSYRRWMSEPYLPADFFESDKTWSLKVTRSVDCDGTVKQMATVYDKDTNDPMFLKEALPKRTRGFESESIPLDKVLPCYVLNPEDVKSLKR